MVKQGPDVRITSVQYVQVQFFLIPVGRIFKCKRIRKTQTKRNILQYDGTHF